MIEPGRDGELTVFNRPQPLEAMESLNLGARASAECQPLCVASWGVVPPLPCPAPPPTPQDSRTGRLWGHPTWADAGGGLGGQSQMAYLLFCSPVGLQRSGRNLGRSGALYMEPFRDD